MPKRGRYLHWQFQHLPDFAITPFRPIPKEPAFLNSWPLRDLDLPVVSCRAFRPCQILLFFCKCHLQRASFGLVSSDYYFVAAPCLACLGPESNLHPEKRVVLL